MAAQLISSSSSAFASKKSQEIGPPDRSLDSPSFDGSSSAFSKKEALDELKLDSSGEHGITPSRKEVEKVTIGSKLKHSLRPPQEDSSLWSSLEGNNDGGGNGEYNDDVGIKPRRSLKFTQEFEKPIASPQDSSFSDLQSIPTTRDREDSISSEFIPSMGRILGFGNENGEDDKYELLPSLQPIKGSEDEKEEKELVGIVKKAPSEGKDAHSPSPSHSPRPVSPRTVSPRPVSPRPSPPLSSLAGSSSPPSSFSSSPLLTFHSPLSTSPIMATKDPLQAMYNSKYTSYGREVEQQTGKPLLPNTPTSTLTSSPTTTIKTTTIKTATTTIGGGERRARGTQDSLRRWWLLFCILFVLCIARWLV